MMHQLITMDQAEAEEVVAAIPDETYVELTEGAEPMHVVVTLQDAQYHVTNPLRFNDARGCVTHRLVVEHMFTRQNILFTAEMWEAPANDNQVAAFERQQQPILAAEPFDKFDEIVAQDKAKRAAAMDKRAKQKAQWFKKNKADFIRLADTKPESLIQILRGRGKGSAWGIRKPVSDGGHRWIKREHTDGGKAKLMAIIPQIAEELRTSNHIT